MGARRVQGPAPARTLGPAPARPMGPRPAGPVARPQSARPMARPMQQRPATAMQTGRPAQSAAGGRPMRPAPAAVQKQAPPKRGGGWKIVAQFLVGLIVIALVAAAVVWLYIKYYSQ